MVVRVEDHEVLGEVRHGLALAQITEGSDEIQIRRVAGVMFGKAAKR